MAGRADHCRRSSRYSLGLRALALSLCVQPVFWMSHVALAQTLEEQVLQRETSRRGGLFDAPSPTPREPFPAPEEGRPERPAVTTAVQPPTPIDEPLDPDRYVCGPGDVLELNFWGVQNFRQRVTIDLEGRAFVAKVGYLNLLGKTLSEARRVMVQSVGRYFPGLGFGVALAEPRTFMVQLVDAVARPGSHPARAIDRVATLIGRAGGFAPKASKRLVEIRRRPFFLLGALPFGAFFALLWLDLGGASQGALFAYYTAMFVLGSLAMTTVSVPYLALLPEMAVGYDARTSLNTWRNAGAVLGVFAAVVFRPVAHALGGGAAGFSAAGALFGVVFALPWLAIHRVSWERPDFQERVPHMGFRDGLRLLLGHRTFRQLTGMYLCGRVSMDLIGAMLILYFTHFLGRSDDFEWMMLAFLTTVLASLPVWLALARHLEKATVFTIGTLWWAAGQLAFLTVQPDWPRWLVFAFAPAIGFGYAVVDLMPWSMIGEVVDEDELASGERREGIYNGFFMFVRKVAGASGVLLAMFVLGRLGFHQGDAQPPAAVEAIRWLATVVPAAMLLLSAWCARGYPLTREGHARILAELSNREALRSQAG